MKRKKPIPSYPSPEDIAARQDMFRKCFADVRDKWLMAGARIANKAAAAKDNELLIYEQIGEDWWTGKGILPADIHAWLKDRKGDDITVRINSPGGSVFDGNAIHNLLKGHDGNVAVVVDGIAASIASIIAMAGDDIVMEPNAMMMIHDPHSFVMGTAEDMLREAEILDTVKGALVDTYVARTRQGAAAVSELMSASTWLTAGDALARGFCDSIEGESPAAGPPASDDSEEARRLRALRMKNLRNRLDVRKRAMEAA